eukprot:scaffold3890_cov984-Pavlova_lutheri.AAC.1
MEEVVSFLSTPQNDRPRGGRVWGGCDPGASFETMHVRVPSRWIPHNHNCVVRERRMGRVHVQAILSIRSGRIVPSVLRDCRGRAPAPRPGIPSPCRW